MSTRTRVRVGEGWSEMSEGLRMEDVFFGYEQAFPSWVLQIYLALGNPHAYLSFYSDGPDDMCLDRFDLLLTRAEAQRLLRTPAREVVERYAEEISWLDCD